MKGCDWGFGKIGGVNIKKAGYSFVCRYLSHNPKKNLTKEEIADFKENDLDIVVVWETTETRCLEGRQAGEDDANSALELLESLGIQHDVPIYFACDQDFNQAQLEKIKDYFDGVIGMIGVDQTGVYGGYTVVKYILDNKLAKYGWQTYAWSHGKWDDRAQLRQTNIYGPRLQGVECDTDESMQDDFGQIT
jgi:hypothetical protein